MIEFPGEDFRQKEREIIIGKNRFGEKGIRLALQVPGLNIKGKLNFGVLSPLKYDIMGPFSLVPFMECRYGGKCASMGKNMILTGRMGIGRGTAAVPFQNNMSGHSVVFTPGH